jgi:rhodanese-related sulfurtransferase
MKNISPREAFDILSHDANAIIIDVRTKQEWYGGIPGCTNLKLVTISSDLNEFENNLQDLVENKNHKSFFICKGGVRSSTAAALATKLGYKDCYNITGGFTEWQHLNLPYKAWSEK